MEELRKPLFVVAVALIAVAFLFEIGSTAILGGADVKADQLRALADAELRKDFPDKDERDDVLDEMVKGLEVGREKAEPPGYGIPSTAMLDVLLIYSVVWMGLSILFPERVLGRVQGVVSLILSLLVLGAAVVLIFRCLIALQIMVSLLFSAPFGTIVYLAVYGFFKRAVAGVVLGWAMFFKLCFAACLVFAHQGFVRNKGLILLVLSSLLATFVVSFLHSFVPLPLVSITDVIAAIVVSIITVIWGVVMLVFAIVSIVKAVA